MYTVELYEYGKPAVKVFDPPNGINYLSSCTLEKQEDSIDTVTMSINHKFVQDLSLIMKPLKTLCKIRNTKKNKIEFVGRVLAPEDSMDSNGLFTHTYVFEGAMAFLQDTVQKYSFEFDRFPVDNLNLLINHHNGEISSEPYKRFVVGNVNVPKNKIPTGEEYVEDHKYFKRWEDKSTYETITSDLIGKYDGHVYPEYFEDYTKIHYQTEPGVKKSTVIELSKNLRSIQRKIDPSEIITRLKPLGATSETANGDELRLTIADVNGGSPYIDIPDLIAIYGIQTGVVDFDKYAPITLKEAAYEWIQEQYKKIGKMTINLDALDLSIIGIDIDDYDLYSIYRTRCLPLNIDDDLRVVGVSIDIMNPQNKSITIGEKELTIDEMQTNAMREISNIVFGGHYEKFNGLINEINSEISIIQAQSDQSINTYFYSYTPTLYNNPAYEWDTETLRRMHEGDYFTDLTTGYVYRFTKSGSSWMWVPNTNQAIVAAMNEARNAKDTADGKRRIFVGTPTPPYDIGDVWTQGNSGDILVSTADRTSFFYAGDWVRASKYTDDTKANSAQSTANSAQSTASSAQSTANTAYNTANAAVPKSNVIAYINASDEIATIYGRKVDITGNATFKSLNDGLADGTKKLNPNSMRDYGITTIDGGKIETDQMTANRINIRRADGAYSVINGEVQFGLNVQRYHPQFTGNAAEVTINGVYFRIKTTNSPSNATYDAFSFRHDGAYLVVNLQCYTSGSGTGYVSVEGFGGTSINQMQSFSSSSPTTVLFRIPIGRPTGDLKYFYLKADNYSASYIYVREIAIYQEG